MGILSCWLANPAGAVIVYALAGQSKNTYGRITMTEDLVCDGID